MYSTWEWRLWRNGEEPDFLIFDKAGGLQLVLIHMSFYYTSLYFIRVSLLYFNLCCPLLKS